jgi:hypothetical protein
MDLENEVEFLLVQECILSSLHCRTATVTAELKYIHASLLQSLPSRCTVLK